MLEYSLIVKLLTEHHFEFLSLKGGCTGSSESTLVKIPHCWKSHLIFSVAGDPFKSEGFTSDPFASEDPFKDAFGTSSSSTNKVSRGEG